MSMLAQGRRKQKISTNPNGLLFTNDQNHIGQKLMSQMGWEKGKGLGANEQGEKDPIKVRMNTENRGLGFKRADVDKWIDHQDDFNSLLANLNEDTEEATSDIPNEQETAKSAVQSLEAKSKSSRARVHYMKFTKGKDLSKHSDKDLACILGPSRSSKTQGGSAVQSTEASAANSDDSNGLADKGNTSDPFLSDALHVTSTLSLQEYFAAKMASKKSSGSNNSLTGLITATPSPTTADTAEDETETVTAVDRPSFFISDTEQREDEVCEETIPKHKKKKKRKEVVEEVEVDDADDALSQSERKERKRRKKKERQDAEAVTHRHGSGGKTKPKPPDESMKFVTESSSEGDLEAKDSTTEICSKSKKGKNKRLLEENELPIGDTGEITSEQVTSKTKKIRKSKSDSLLMELEHCNKQTEDEENGGKQKKKKRKHKSKEL